MLVAALTLVPTRTALVVDDESVVRMVLRRFLEGRGWEIFEAGSAEEALALLEDPRMTFDVVMCDLNLPGISGSALCGQITTLRPDLASRLIITTGDPSAAAADIERESLDCIVLAKPFSLGDLDRVLGGVACAA